MRDIHVVFPLGSTVPECVVDGQVFKMHRQGHAWVTDEPVVDGLPIVFEPPRAPRAPRFEFMPFGPVLASSFRRKPTCSG